jgi:hypothetical protein
MRVLSTPVDRGDKFCRPDIADCRDFLEFRPEGVFKAISIDRLFTREISACLNWSMKYP